MRMPNGKPLILLAFVAVAAAGLPASAGDLGVDVANSPPVVTSVTLPSTVTPTAGATTSVSTTVVVTDLNGHNDVTSVAVEILKPDSSTTHVASASATRTSASATSATYTRTFTMAYHDAPATGSSTYKVKVTVTDAAGATGTNVADLAVFNYAELAALSLGSETMEFGTDVAPGATSSAVASSVANRGNVRVDVQVSGTALAHDTVADASIPVSSVAYSTSSDMSGSAALSGSATTLTDFDLATGSSSAKDLHWTISVPSGDSQYVPSGDYTGTLTLGAVAG